MREKMARGIAAGTGLVIIVAVVLFGILQQRVAETAGNEIDPKAWATIFPRHYDALMRTRIDYGRTTYGGSTPYDKLASNPFRRRAWAGHPFELAYNAARGHYYAQIDQQKSHRTRERDQPAACIHCHAAEAPLLLEEYGWEGFHKMRYDELRDRLHHGTSCRDCHSPATMELQITRPAFLNAMKRRGIDVSAAGRQEMRSYVCAQCHVEYYFRGANQELVFPWNHGIRVEDIERHFDEYGFQDWTHAKTGAPLIKIQHPDFELFSTGVHYGSGVACADCHMPYIREGGALISDHWIRSPLMNLSNACQSCHTASEDRLRARVVEIQHRTAELLGTAEAALADLMDAIVTAQEAGVQDAALEDARRFHRRAQLRWDFVDAENSTGFHSPQEAARILTHAVDFARRGERSALEAIATHQGVTLRP
jgi:nitrite reductase (cytochrome c-552)